MHECLVHTQGTYGQLILAIPLPQISLGKHNVPLQLGYSLFPFAMLQWAISILTEQELHLLIMSEFLMQLLWLLSLSFKTGIGVPE